MLLLNNGHTYFISEEHYYHHHHHHYYYFCYYSQKSQNIFHKKKNCFQRVCLKKRSILHESIKRMDILKWHYKHIFLKHDYFLGSVIPVLCVKIGNGM